MIIPNRLTIIFFFLLQASSISQSIRASDSRVPDYILAYAVCMLTTVVHEAGHAATIKALYDESCDINVGAFSCGGMIIGHLLNLIPHPGFDGHNAYEAFKKWRASAGK